ncbi:MAG: hypothetical protein JWQ14_770 [Adhaeribacter sp.]|nr:hypothetical protein [Adhaeribacter sp.]
MIKPRKRLFLWPDLEDDAIVLTEILLKLC